VTDQEQQLPPSKAKKRFGRSPAFYVAVASCAGMIIGGFGPWFTNGDVSLNGTTMINGDGWRPIVAAGAALVFLALFAASGRGWLVWLAMLCGVFGVWYCARDISDASHLILLPDFSGSSASVTAAWGLWVATISSGLLVVSAVIARVAAPRR
jgi:hypothetical protein